MKQYAFLVGLISLFTSLAGQVSPPSLLADPSVTTARPTAVRTADVIVYGGTSAAVMAAVQVKKMGKSVIVVSPDKHLGGLSAGGAWFHRYG